MSAIATTRRFGDISLPAGQSITGGQLVVGNVGPVTRTVTDGATTSASTAITSATAAFQQADIGDTITGAGIPAGTTIAAVTSATAATLSQAATATATGVTFTITVVVNPDANSTDVAYVAGANATTVLGVALIDAAPYSPNQATPTAAYPFADRVTIGAHGEFPVTYAAATNIGQSLKAAANGAVTPWVDGIDTDAGTKVGYCTQTTASGAVGRAYIGR